MKFDKSSAANISSGAFMDESVQDDPRKKEIEILNKAFQSFNDVTQQLEKSYEKLQERVKELDLELAKKNEELEKNLAEKEEVKNYLNNILQSLTTGVIVVDQQNKITTFNKNAGAIMGVESETCPDKTLGEIFSNDIFDSAVRRLTESGEENLILDEVVETLDNRLVNLRVSASPVLDNQARQVGTVLIIQDMTQLHKLEEEAQRNDRLRAMGEVAAGIAHEIRNPLGSIELFASMLVKDLLGDNDKQALAEHIVSGVRTMDRIISSLLLFAKSPGPSRQSCDVNELLRGLLNSPVHNPLPENIKVVNNLGLEALKVNGDGELLRQVFVNLIRNAVQAMPKGGDLKVSAEPSATDERNHRNFIIISVTDTGDGITVENKDNIFNPFFTTKDKGTGLGLAIAHNIIKAHQGTIDVKTEDGRGTTFIVKVPSWDESAIEN